MYLLVPVGPWQIVRVENLHLPLPIPVAFAASISKCVMSLMPGPPASCPHVAAGNTLPVNKTLALRHILAKDTVLGFLA